MQDETPIIAVRNTIPATGDPSAANNNPLPSEGNDQKWRGYWIVPKPNGRSSGTDHPKARDQASDTPCRHSSTAARRPDFGLALGASTKTLTLKFPCHLNRFAKENAWWRRSQNSREGIGVNVL
jgi:hypothetical protein